MDLRWDLVSCLFSYPNRFAVNIVIILCNSPACLFLCTTIFVSPIRCILGTDSKSRARAKLIWASCGCGRREVTFEYVDSFGEGDGVGDGAGDGADVGATLDTCDGFGVT